MNIIEGRKISFRYPQGRRQALREVSLIVQEGEFIALLGHNGCGKSTLARHINGILPLQEGSLLVAGMDACGKVDVWKLRRKVGMVFQNPDNQFVSSVVEDDVAFGLENYQVSRDVIPGKVSEALKQVGMEGFEKRMVHSLSGGQKQRAALAGVLALDPDIFIFDEATAMLDPEGRAEVLDQIEALHGRGRTILMITHYVEEAVRADRVILMKDGEAIAAGSPREVLSQGDLLAQTGLLPPQPARVWMELKEQGLVPEDPEDRCPLTEEELAEKLCRSRSGA